MPTRHQRPPRGRLKGWKKPAGAVMITRPNRWGNPHPIGTPCPVPRCDGATHGRAGCIGEFMRDLRAGEHRRYVAGKPTGPALGIPDAVRELAGRDLVCACETDVACHGDVLIEFANNPEETS